MNRVSLGLVGNQTPWREQPMNQLGLTVFLPTVGLRHLSFSMGFTSMSGTLGESPWLGLRTWHKSLSPSVRLKDPRRGLSRRDAPKSVGAE